MAAKPTIKQITPIDAQVGGIIKVSYSGTLPKSHEIVIRDAISLKEIYRKTTQSSSISPIQIPKDVLKNGKRYCVTVQYDVGATSESIVSDPEYFLTIATPTFSFKDLDNDASKTNIVTKASMVVELNYNQPNNETINTLQYTLLDSDHKIYQQSKVLVNPSDLTYTFKNLQENQVYYLQAEARTSHGISLITNQLRLLVRYDFPANNAHIKASADANGTVNGYTNIIIIEPTRPDPELYEFDDGWIDLRDDYLEYKDGYMLDGNFTLSVRIKNMNKNTTLLKAGNGTEFFTLDNFEYNDKTRFRLKVPGYDGNYILFSDALTIKTLEVVCIYIRRINNVYALYINKYSEEEKNMFFSDESHNPIADASKYDIWLDMATGSVKIDKNDVTVYYQNSKPENNQTATVLDGGVPTEKTAQLEQYQVWIGGTE